MGWHGCASGVQLPGGPLQYSKQKGRRCCNSPTRFKENKETMNNAMIQPHEHAVKMGRFVAPESEWEQGKRLHSQRKPITECTTDEMADGWCAAADLAGYMAYSRHMEAEGYTCAKAFAFEAAH